MSLRWIQLLLGLSLLVNAFVLAGFVYRSWIAPPPVLRHGFLSPGPPGGSGGPMNPANRPSPLDVVTHDLVLDDSQKQMLNGLVERYNARRQESYREYQKLREQMVAELQKPELDMGKLDALADQASTMRAAQLKETLRAIAELSQELRPEQRERLHKAVAERYSGSAWTARPQGGTPGHGPWQGPPPGPAPGPATGPAPGPGQGRPPQ